MRMRGVAGQRLIAAHCQAGVAGDGCCQGVVALVDRQWSAGSLALPQRRQHLPAHLIAVARAQGEQHIARRQLGQQQACRCVQVAHVARVRVAVERPDNVQR